MMKVQRKKKEIIIAVMPNVCMTYGKLHHDLKFNQRWV